MRTRRSQSSGSPVPPYDSTQGTSPEDVKTHQSVLLHEVVRFLGPEKGDVILDATLGGAGHAKALAKHLGEDGIFVGLDLDADALERARNELAPLHTSVHLLRANFRDLGTHLKTLGIETITKALFDLGWSSYQLDSGRGFSYGADEPLLMTYAKEPKTEEITAEKIVNTWSGESLADIIFGWGEERYSRRIAKAIVAVREKHPFKTSRQLADVIAASVPPSYRHGRIHPATRTFQALRIAVNDELGALKSGLTAAWAHLAPGGRIAVISFHSLEDRLVKRQFQTWDKEGVGIRITKKPLVAGPEETKSNPRARSAKLRVIEKAHTYESKNTKNKQIRPLDISGEN